MAKQQDLCLIINSKLKLTPMTALKLQRITSVIRIIRHGLSW